MKYRLLLCLTAFCLLNCSSSTNVAQTDPIYQGSAQEQAPIELIGIQAKIDTAMKQAMVGNTPQLADLEAKLIKATEQVESPNLLHYYRYWTGYLLYNKAIPLMGQEDKSGAKKALEDAMAMLDKVKEKDSEVYALLGSATSFYFQFIPQQEYMVYMRKVSNYLGKAMETGPENPRAYYVNATYDFYTPAEYGGGQKAEEWLKKAISLPDTDNSSPFAPTWGKDLSYDLLIQHYVAKKELSKAKATLAEAKEHFPESELLVKWSSI